MNILIIHNKYSLPGGEENVVEMQCSLFEKRGYNVYKYSRSYSEIYGWKFGRIRSLFTSIYNPKAAREVDKLVRENKIDIALVHNIFPVISPSVLPLLKRRGVKIIWIAHNYRLLCPIGVFYTKGNICEKCSGGFRELNCLMNRCEGSLLGSFAYALRAASARISGVIARNVDKYVALTNFQRDKFIENGFSPSSVAVIGNCSTFEPLEPSDNNRRNNKILFVGRLSDEKGIKTLFEVARLLPSTPFIVAGGGSLLKEWGSVPQNVEILGGVDKSKLKELYRTSQMLIITSKWYEGFPMVAIEASLSLCPIVAPALGCFTSLIKDNINGVLYVPSSVESLLSKIELLQNDSALALKIALENQRLSLSEYSLDSYYRGYKDLFDEV